MGDPPTSATRYPERMRSGDAALVHEAWMRLVVGEGPGTARQITPFA